MVCHKNSDGLHVRGVACRELGNLCNDLTDKPCAKKAFEQGCTGGNGKACLGMAMIEMFSMKSKASISKKELSVGKKYLTKAKELLSTECSEGDNESCQTMPALSEIWQKFGIE